MADRFAVNQGWQILLKDLGMKPAEILQRANLPGDLFSRKEASLSTQEYFALWEALEASSGDAVFPIRLIESLSAEVFDPPIFAAYCSPNLNVALKRLSQFKALICPMTLEVVEGKQTTQLTVYFHDNSLDIPAPLVAAELGFFVQLARMATRERIVPIKVIAPIEFPNLDEYRDYFGITPDKGKTISVTFSAEDAQRPFVTENEQMWNFFEPELRKRLADIKADEGFTNRVKAALHEMLPSGQCSIDDVARKLLVSKRTLQRRLGDEETNYQTVLSGVREELAKHYVKNSELPYAQISFLLGYDDPNSFFRAFNTWTGSTPERVRFSAVH